MTRRMFVVPVVVALLVGFYVLTLPETPDTATTTAATVEMELESLRQLAQQGDAGAQYNLGFVYERGLGVPQDDVEAARWTRLAADQGHALAQLSLGDMYAYGRGVPQDYVEAHKWVNLAASRATGAAQKRYSERRDTLAKQMTPAQIAEAQKLAREWQVAFDARQE